MSGPAGDGAPAASQHVPFEAHRHGAAKGHITPRWGAAVRADVRLTKEWPNQRRDHLGTGRGQCDHDAVARARRVSAYARRWGWTRCGWMGVWQGAWVHA